MNNIGLYFGSFNPVHNGHLMIANYILEYSDISQIWFIVSPQNPLKKRNSLLADYHRLEMISRAIDGFEGFKVSNIEFNMPKPSYTVDTLAYLNDKYPNKKFSLIMGGDNLSTINKWKNYDEILKHYKIYVYPRPDATMNHFYTHKNVQIINAPLIEISSSFIRKSIANNKDIRFFMPSKAYEFMDEMNFYKA